jgi:hypothetical protein
MAGRVTTPENTEKVCGISMFAAMYIWKEPFQKLKI